MNAIGIRAHPQQVWFAVVTADDGAPTLKTVSALKIPPALETPAQLQFVRTTILDIIGEYSVGKAGIRTAEPSAQSLNVFRLNLEGVIQELLASGAVRSYFAGPIVTIASRLAIKERTLIKKYIDGELNFPGTTNWQQFVPEAREAILAALAAVRLGRPTLTAVLAEV